MAPGCLVGVPALAGIPPKNRLKPELQRLGSPSCQTLPLDLALNMTEQSDMAAGQDTGRLAIILLRLVFFFSGAAGLIYQVVWQRLLTVYYGVGPVATTLIVSIYMLGLGLGALVGGAAAERIKSRVTLYMLVELLLGTLRGRQPLAPGPSRPRHGGGQLSGGDVVDGPVPLAADAAHGYHAAAPDQGRQRRGRRLSQEPELPVFHQHAGGGGRRPAGELRGHLARSGWTRPPTSRRQSTSCWPPRSSRSAGSIGPVRFSTPAEAGTPTETAAEAASGTLAAGPTCASS